MVNLTKDMMALNAFNALLISLEKVKDLDTGRAWKASATETIKKHLGPTTAFLEVLANTYFTIKVKVLVEDSIWKNNTIQKHEYRDYQKEKFKSLVNTIIQHITSHGADFTDERQPVKTPSPPKEFPSHKVEKTNWLHGWTNIALIVAAVPALYGFWQFGEVCGEKWARADRSEEFSKLYTDYKELEKEHRDLKVFFERQKHEKQYQRQQSLHTIKKQDCVIDSLNQIVAKSKIRVR